MTVNIIEKHLPGFKSDAWLVERDGLHFIVSGVTAFDTGRWEVLVFPSDSSGKVLNWGDVCGGRGITHSEAINRLDEIPLETLRENYPTPTPSPDES